MHVQFTKFTILPECEMQEHSGLLVGDCYEAKYPPDLFQTPRDAVQWNMTQFKWMTWMCQLPTQNRLTVSLPNGTFRYTGYALYVGMASRLNWGEVALELYIMLGFASQMLLWKLSAEEKSRTMQDCCMKSKSWSPADHSTLCSFWVLVYPPLACSWLWRCCTGGLCTMLWGNQTSSNGTTSEN